MHSRKTTDKTVGILHPGEMGIFVAKSLLNAGHTVYWVSTGRSEKTRKRASALALEEVDSLESCCSTVDAIISVCPPHAAEEMAARVLAQPFKGIYVDANAISPQRTRRIADLMQAQGVDFVDGGIVGLPTTEPGRTWLHLSGKRADEIAALFASGPMETNIVGEQPGQASALKMCYAAYNKGLTALLCSVLGTADAMDVREQLEQQWARHWPGFPEESHQRIRRITGKAWRFTGEMQEIAATFRAAGLPGEFHQGAEDIYQRMSSFKDAPALPSIDEVLQALIGKNVENP